MRYLGAIESTVYVIAFAFGAWRGVEELHTALVEKLPTVIAIEKFSTDYRGQRWLALRGRFPHEHRCEEVTIHTANQTKPQSYLFVPVVSERWQPNESVRVVGVFGPFSLDEVRAWVKQHHEQPIDVVTGVTRTDVYNFSHLFPRLQPAESVVYVNSGTRPSGLPNALFFLGVCLVSLVLLIRMIRREVRTA